MNENQIAKEVVDAAVKVNTKLGPGLLESVYEAVLARESWSGVVCALSGRFCAE